VKRRGKSAEGVCEVKDGGVGKNMYINMNKYVQQIISSMLLYCTHPGFQNKFNVDRNINKYRNAVGIWKQFLL
jgi:hypothetical protein